MVIYTVFPSAGFDSNQEAKSLISLWATGDDRTQAAARAHGSRQHDFLLTRSALRALLFQATQHDNWHIVPDTNGKPYARKSDGTSGPFISLSHTKGMVACAVSMTDPVGTDIEYWRTRDFESIADYAFSPQEQSDVRRDGAAAFYRIWTLREAWAKANGIGVMATFDGRDRGGGLMATGLWKTDAARFFYSTPQPNYSLTIAVLGEGQWSEVCVNYMHYTSILNRKFST